MKVLMLSPLLPWPLDLGARIRIYHSVRVLGQMGHDVTLICINTERFEPSAIEVLRHYCRELKVVSASRRSRHWTALRALLSNKPYGVVKFWSPSFQQTVENSLKVHYDVLWVHFIETLAYLPGFAKGRKCLIVLDQHNADERFWATFSRSGPPWVRLFAWQNIWNLRRFQRQVLRKVDVVLSVSEEDAVFTRARLPSPSTQVWVVPNGVDTEYLQTKNNEERRNRIIFCGAMDIFMNIDAVVCFAKKVFPMVRESIPDAEFWVVGRDPAPEVRALANLPGIYVTGRVEDVRPYYAQAKVAVAPFRYGGGTKLKVLEAMALGVPVVATSVGCQGIEAIPGKHLFVAERDEEFARQVNILLEDEVIWKRVTSDARRLVEQKYSWESILRGTIARLEQLISKPGEGVSG
ncbi:MAG: glycosyltransferase [Anaerolineae bacterium]|nr:glycosyltransferase [Anaerolineae bacterium]